MNTAILIASLIAALGIVYDTVEFYQARHEVLEKFYNWRVVRSRYYILVNRPVLGLAFDALFARRTFIGLVVAHGLAAVAFPVIFYVNPALAALPAAMVLGVHCLTNVRLMVGRDGADQMQNIVWGGLLAYCLPLHESVKLVAVGFIVAQLLLSYIVSGVAKLISPVWRKGTALGLITRMATYCPPAAARLFSRPAVSFAVCWFTILFELLAPGLLFFGHTGAVIFIVLGTLFHGGIALSMGLTTFVFAFLATYPLVYELAGWLWTLWH